MRLVSWNCQGGFERKRDAIEALHPDVLVVPEASQASLQSRLPFSQPVSDVHWVGETPAKGLGVLAFGDYRLARIAPSDPAQRWILPLQVSGPESFLLLAVWTLPTGKERSYVQPLVQSLARYRQVLRVQPVVWAGDFNANVSFRPANDGKEFAGFVDQLAGLGIRSVYHTQTGSAHGQEADPTFFLNREVEKRFHIDYVFASEGLLRKDSRLTVGSHDEWSAWSDHMPLVFDL